MALAVASVLLLLLVSPKWAHEMESLHGNGKQNATLSILDRQNWRFYFFKGAMLFGVPLLLQLASSLSFSWSIVLNPGFYNWQRKRERLSSCVLKTMLLCASKRSRSANIGKPSGNLAYGFFSLHRSHTIFKTVVWLLTVPCWSMVLALMLMNPFFCKFLAVPSLSFTLPLPSTSTADQSKSSIPLLFAILSLL